MAKKTELITPRFGRPKEMLDTPRVVLHPSSCRTRRRVSRATAAPRLSELTVRQRASMRMFFRAIP